MTNLRSRIAAAVTALHGRAWDEIAPASPPDQVLDAPRDQGVNHQAICAAMALLSLCDDVTPVVMRPVLEGGFDLRRDFGIDPRPLWGFNAPATARALLDAFFGVWPLPADPAVAGLAEALEAIRRGTLLGENTVPKLAYVPRANRDESFGACAERLWHTDDTGFAWLFDHTVDLLDRQVGRLPPGHPKATEASAVRQALARLRQPGLLVRRFHRHPWLAGHPGAFETLFADEIVAWLAPDCGRAGDPALHRPRGSGIELAFAPRNAAFLTLGDRYGDCTASRVRAQVDEDIANIHWTVCAWLLDPYYRVIEVFSDGKPALKGHVLPLVIDERPVFMVDAIEAVPELRELKDGSENPMRDRALYEVKDALLDTLLQVCTDLARRMGVEVVYVERFSNARWVRARLEVMPSDSYDVWDVEKPYETRIVEATIARVLGLKATTPRQEIQARNTRLMHQDLAENHKEVTLLAGPRSARRLRVRTP
ncbi:conserved protein of unknown function [Rhodovastum atsumiense]|uniref:Uncharacterized protein n=1 Tax=Rhodovastum atsumiense TaxID=504468 RepID=A0A5M6ISP3_9PROT|nr:hypothetical protein [Rhodovastum atsumiense]KAA5611221.1 hypothetical protein F1189_15750 [Rhodovastum atsumiense]CAH2602467.1 conserved protein of unknown function [Rhodovastum atsumiense]